MGVVDDLARAREAYERREWVAAYDSLSDVDASALDADDFARLSVMAFLLGRKNDCVQAMQRAYRVYLDRGETLRAVRCAFWLGMVLLMSGEPAVGGGWVGAVPSPARRGRGRRGRARLPAHPRDVQPHLRRRARAGLRARPAGDRLRAPLRGRRPDGQRAQRPGADADLHRPRPGGARPAGRGDGRHLDGRRVTDRRRRDLLLADRGLPGGLRLRPGGRVDQRADRLGRRPAGTGHLHGPERGAPRADHAHPRRLPRGDRGVPPRDRAVRRRRNACARGAGHERVRRRAADRR